MEHLSFNRLLMHQTLIVHEIGLYQKDTLYLPKPRELLLLDGVRSRAQETQDACLKLKDEFWNRISGEGDI